MVLIQCSTDRWQAHQQLSLQFSLTNKRNYLWRYVGEGEALVRIQSEAVEIPETGAMISFRTDCVPVRKLGGKRRHIEFTDAGIGEWLLKRVSSAIDIHAFEFRMIPFRVNRKNEIIIRPAIRIWGRGQVLEQEPLHDILVNGIGDAKAYGFGLFEIERN